MGRINQCRYCIIQMFMKKTNTFSSVSVMQRIALLLFVKMTCVFRSIEGLSAAEKITILESHNKARRCVEPPAANMPDLEWSKELEDIAQNYARKCKWGHNPSRAFQSPFKNVGENIFITTVRNGSVQDGMNRWLGEKVNYNYMSNSCSKTCGHYTQAVWAESRFIGCGVASCPTMTNLPSIFRNTNYLVFNYGPAGNIVGQRPYKEGSTPSSSCK